MRSGTREEPIDYFSADNSIRGRDLYTSDGTATGTELVCDLFPRINASNPDALTICTYSVQSRPPSRHSATVAA